MCSIVWEQGKGLLLQVTRPAGHNFTETHSEHSTSFKEFHTGTERHRGAGGLNPALHSLNSEHWLVLLKGSFLAPSAPKTWRETVVWYLSGNSQQLLLSLRKFPSKNTLEAFCQELTSHVASMQMPQHWGKPGRCDRFGFTAPTPGFSLSQTGFLFQKGMSELWK